MKQVVFTILLIIFIRNTYAQDYFIFYPHSRYVYQSNELEVEFFYNFEGYGEEDFLVRPKIGRGNIEIYDKKNNTWISQNGLWTTMPALEKAMKVRVLLEGEADMWFEIQNVLDQEIYATPKEKIWGGSLYGNYIDLINQNLRYLMAEEELTRLPQHENKPEERLSLVAKVIKYIDDII